MTSETRRLPRPRVWLLGTLLALCALALAVLWSWHGSARDGAGWIPLENDSFFHAYRIIEAASGELPQFDARIHAPEGSLVVWPWAYDAFLGLGLKLAQWIQPGLRPMQLLAWWGPALLLLNLGLVALTARRLGLRPGVQLVVFACVALCPQILFRHAFGMLDHHGAELTAALLALWTGLRWTDAPTRANAVLHAVVLGLALGIHNGLFLLQAFSLLTIGWLWLRRDARLRATLPHYAVALVAATLLIALPSLAFQQGLFEYYLLSWFHLVAACCTAAAAVAMSRWAPDRSGLAVIAAIGAGCGALLAWLAKGSASFVSGDMAELRTIGETISIWESLDTLGTREFISYYTLPALMAPLTIAALAFAPWLEGRRAWLAVFTVLGFALFALQSRFWTYGLVPSILCAGVALETLLRRSPQPLAQQALVLTLAGALFLALVPASVAQPPPRGGSHWYAPVEAMLPTLAKVCDSGSGTVLADANYGHFITYHTDCSVVANNFILTSLQLEKRRTVREWFALSAEQYRQDGAVPELVLVDAPPALLRHFARTGVEPRRADPRRLVRELLAETPDGFEIIAESRMGRGAQQSVVMRLLRKRPMEPARSTAPDAREGP